ncbi:glycosyltransferase [Methylobacterium sp. J-076]|uniref:glycosyltransferase n=1 Tax=Methylobacterium sp. J-076 TaxID=2836655 RepID=UPI001FB90412|nr:glycosyltransferase [Methylobacterium sp. J-076]MCJ2011122.1 glycosyltransferase [Methylobacterium sp. J-076]
MNATPIPEAPVAQPVQSGAVQVQEARRRALSAMRAPAQMKIICIDITNKCDLGCSNCTRLLVNQDKHWDMSPDNFRLALRSLRGYPGTIAVIGGNPCMHPKFAELCEIFVEEVPDKGQRGLWTNNVFKHAELSMETFGVFNLNPHNSARGVESLKPLKDLGWYHGGHSDHSSLLAAIQDLYEPVEMWERIGRCDVNQNWSASIVQVRGGLKAYFCEVAAAFDLARGGEHGMDVVPGWWERPLDDFHGQVDRFCPGCGVPAKVKGHLDHDEIDTYSHTNADLAERSAKKKNRKVVKVDRSTFKNIADIPVTSYSSYLRQQGPHIFIVTPYYQESLDVLRRCHESVMAQQIEARLTHVMIADGHPREEIDGWDVLHVRLPKAHGDNGNTPRAIGTVIAETNGAEFMAFLDADNWYYPDHLSSMLEAMRETGASVACSWRHYFGPDGEQIPVVEQDEMELRHVDTSCIVLSRAAFEVNQLWSSMPRILTPWCDRVFMTGLRHRRHVQCYTRKKTVAFTTIYTRHFLDLNLPPPANSKMPPDDAMLAYLQSLEGVQETVRRMGFWPLAI